MTVTDANLFLNRLLPKYFPSIFGPTEDLPLDYEVTKTKFIAMTHQINNETGGNMTPEEVALGFLGVANEAMCRPIRALTEAKGFDVSAHRLAVFGGAGGQHACSIADKLGIHTVIMHRYSSILSAYGMALASLVQEAQEPASLILCPETANEVSARFQKLQKRATEELFNQGVSRDQEIEVELYLNLRYDGSDTQMMIRQPEDGDFTAAFEIKHKREFTFLFPNKNIHIDDIRVRAVARENERQMKNVFTELANQHEIPLKSSNKLVKTYFADGGWRETQVIKLSDLVPGNRVRGPAIIIDKTQTIVVTPASSARVLEHHINLQVGVERSFKTTLKKTPTISDPIQLSIFSHRFMSIAEQMGNTLQKTAVSINIKERLDFSCAIFGPDGGLVANAPHIPVHLGSMQYAVKYQHEKHGATLKPGDVLVSNHPIAGGTHLPDITVITPVFSPKGEIIFYTASRGHHRDIGGFGGISGNANATEIWQEGASIISFKLVSNGVMDEAGITKILVEEPAQYPDCVGSMSIKDNLSDLKAQVAANAKGALLIEDLFEYYGQEVVQVSGNNNRANSLAYESNSNHPQYYMHAIRKTAEMAVRNFLKQTAKSVPGRTLKALDYLDNGTPIQVEISIHEDGSADFDFTGSGPESLTNLNAPKSVCLSAIIYCLRCLINDDIPLNQGCLASIRVINPEGTILNPSTNAAVYAGNTQTSQRVVDVILRAFQACAASQGCMNSMGFFGGRDAKPGKGYGFAYGETVCGGAGAGPTWDGASAVHTHMTNTRISDLEILEKRYPIILREFSLRKGSGGRGLHTGGLGVNRVIEARDPMTFSMISERRVTKPWGLNGGFDGQCGLNLVRQVGTDGKRGRLLSLGGRGVVKMNKGDQFIVHTPGGGGWGTPS